MRIIFPWMTNVSWTKKAPLYKTGRTCPHKCLLGGLVIAAEIILEFVDMVYHPKHAYKKIPATISCTMQNFTS